MRKLVRGVGEMLITFGVIVALFAGYELWGTGQYTQRQQDALEDELQRRWGSSTQSQNVRLDGAAIGDGVAVLWIPKFGREYNHVIVEGVGTEQLKKRPGHYPGTALPGQVGNFVLSGHRKTYLAPFNRINELGNGAPIVIETADKWFVYRVYDKEIVEPTALEVIEPVPFRPGAEPTKRLITLTTCHPKYSAQKRLIVFGELAEARPKGNGPPRVLAQVAEN